MSKLYHFTNLSIVAPSPHNVRVMPLSNYDILYGQAFKYSWGHSELQTHF